MQSNNIAFKELNIVNYGWISNEQNRFSQIHGSTSKIISDVFSESSRDGIIHGPVVTNKVGRSVGGGSVSRLILPAAVLTVSVIAVLGIYTWQKRKKAKAALSSEDTATKDSDCAKSH